MMLISNATRPKTTAKPTARPSVDKCSHRKGRMNTGSTAKAIATPGGHGHSLWSHLCMLGIVALPLYEVHNTDFSRAEQGTEKVGALAPASLKQAPSGAKAQVLC